MLAATIKEDLEHTSGPRAFSCSHWRKDPIEVSSEIRQDHRILGSLTWYVVNLMMIGQPAYGESPHKFIQPRASTVYSGLNGKFIHLVYYLVYQKTASAEQ